MSNELTGEQQFWRLPRDGKEDIFNGNIIEIGGRAVDISQLAGSIYVGVRDFYPINEVPREMQSALIDLKMQARQFETTFDEILRIMVAEVRRRRERGNQ